MSDRNDSGLRKDQVPDEMVSIARRWIVKAGVATPVILTLRGRPLFAQGGCSAWASYVANPHTSRGYIPTCQTAPTQPKP
jgi:hypothetical protein